MKPLKGRLIVDEVPIYMIGRIVLPTHLQKGAMMGQPTQARVLAVADDVLDVKEGDLIVMDRMHPMQVAGTNLVIPYDAVLGILEEKC